MSISNALGSVLRAFHGKSNAPFAILLIFIVLHVPEVTCVKSTSNCYRNFGKLNSHRFKSTSEQLWTLIFALFTAYYELIGKVI